MTPCPKTQTSPQGVLCLCTGLWGFPAREGEVRFPHPLSRVCRKDGRAAPNLTILGSFRNGSQLTVAGAFLPSCEVP